MPGKIQAGIWGDDGVGRWDWSWGLETIREPSLAYAAGYDFAGLWIGFWSWGLQVAQLAG